MEQTIYTVEQAAKLLQMHPVTVRRKIREGRLLAFMTNGDSGEYRIKQANLDAYTASREREREREREKTETE